MKKALLQCLALLLLVVAGAVEAAEPRIALVIGNGGYEVGPLRNPVADAQLVAQTLRGLGFQVIEATDANRAAMVRAIQKLGQQLGAAGPGAVGLFYYSGHGVQSEGVNYLLPVHESIESEADLLPSAVDAGWVLRQMEQAGNALNIVILDACRNNHLAKSSRSQVRGLARMEAPMGSVIAFATDADNVAYDGSGLHSPYTNALVKAMGTPGLELNDVLNQVSNDVYNATKSESVPQIPVQVYKLPPKFYFSAAAAPAPVAYDPHVMEAAAYDAAKAANTLEAWRMFKKDFPTSGYGAAADIQIALLEHPATVVAVVAAPQQAIDLEADPGGSLPASLGRLALVETTGTETSLRFMLLMREPGNPRLARIASSHEPLRFPSFSPDGSTLAFVGTNRGHAALYVQKWATGELRQLASDVDSGSAPAWSPDGNSIAAVLVASGHRHVYLLDRDGTGKKKAATQWRDDMDDYDPAWSPDGAGLALAAGSDGKSDIYILKNPGTASVQNTRLTTTGDMRMPRYAADGAALVFTRSDGAHSYPVIGDLKDITRKAPLPAIAVEGRPAFSPDGSALLAASGGTIQGFSRDGGAQFSLKLGSGSITDFDVAVR